MLLYEVECFFSPHLYQSCLNRLKPHIETMLSFDGFLHAYIATPLEQENNDRVKVHYHIKDKQSFDDYLTHHAKNMRQSSSEQFDFKDIKRRLYDYALMDKK